MAHFGQYLLAKNLITEQQLAAVMLEQTAALPHPASVLYRDNQLSDQELIAVLSLQDQKHLDFKSACQELNIWQDSFTDSYQQFLACHQKSLAQLLLEQKYITAEQLVETLPEFTSQPEVEAISPPANVSDDVNIDSESTEVVAIKLPACSVLATENIADYASYFNDEKVQSFEQITLQLEDCLHTDNLQHNYELLDQLFTEYHSLKGAARNIHASLTEQIIHKTEDLLSFFKMFYNKVSASDYTLLVEKLFKTQDMLVEIRDQISISQSEQDYLANHQVKFQKHITGIAEILKELESRNYCHTLDELNDFF